MTRLKQVILALYGYGVKPFEINQMSLYEMTEFLDGLQRKELDMLKYLAHLAYSAGLVGSMSFSSKRPKFKDLFAFPELESPTLTELDKHKNSMLVWAEEMNRMSRRSGIDG